MRYGIQVLVCLLLAATAGLPPAGGAGERRALVVLDRGRDARDAAEADAALALALVRTLQQRGADVLLLCVTADERGRQKVTAPPATPAGIAALSTDEALAAAGATDPRAVLRTALAGQAGAVPIDLYLVGAFSPPPEDARRDLERAVVAWNEKAPPESHVFPIRLTQEAAEALADVRGLHTSGWIVTALEDPVLDAHPFSPLPDPADPAGGLRLEAKVTVAARVLRVGSAGDPPPLLVATADGPDDKLAGRAVESLQLFDLSRRLRDGRTATVSFRTAQVADLHWLCEAPGPLTFSWDRLRPDARLLGSQDEAAVLFEAVDARAGRPITRTYRLLRTRSGPTPAWRAGEERLPPGLTWSLGPEIAASADLAESTVRLVFEARAGTPLQTQGTLTLVADGMPEALSIPYVVRVQAGRARLRVTPVPLALPPASADEPVGLTIEALNDNVPASLPIRMRGEAATLAGLQGTVTEADGHTTTWRLTEPLRVPVGVPLTLILRAVPSAGHDRDEPGTLRIEPQRREGVEFEGGGEFEVRRRAPRLVVAEPAPSLRVEGGRVVVVQPLALRLEADGGDGDWLLGLMQRPPAIRDARGGISAWTVTGHEPGVWRLEPDGAWAGREARVFDGRRETVHLTVTWDGGDAPGEIAVPVAVPARWGARGWLFVGLAALALTLGVLAFVLMRVPRVGGTLLYAIEGMQGAVGRIDLRPVGRRRAIVRADERGRLALGGAGEALLRIEPTRVGGMVEVLGGEAPGVRRLLVEGLALNVGTHRLRYLSGAASQAAAASVDVPDLLGPEFDIESGRIESGRFESLGEDGDEPSAS